MSTKMPTRPAKQWQMSTVPRIVIVASEYNPEFVQGLVNNTCKEIFQINDECDIELLGSPGAFEIPVVAEMVAAQRKPDIIIALGLIMQGETKHAEFIVKSVSDALQQVALKHVIPVIHEVLLVSSEEEARERCLSEDLNRGIEAARAAFAMIRVKGQLKKQPSLR